MARIGQILVLLMLGCVGCQRGQDFGQNLIGYFTGRTPIRAVAQMEDRYFPDERRQGINRLVERSWGRREPYTDRYMEIAQYDSDYLVRATAIRALNRSRDAGATPVFVKALDDPNALVRQEAAKALANLPDPDAVPRLLKLLNDQQEQRDVRIAAANALRHYKQIEVARALTTTLSAREFGVAWQSRRSLVSMTRQDFRYNEADWLQYLTGTQRPFS